MSFADILEKVEAERRRKLAAKLPEYSELGISIPSSLALEQCSSTAAAEFKLSVAERFLAKPLNRVVDITGGLGVDCFAFASKAQRVDYYERNLELLEAARENARLVGLDNIDFHNEEVGVTSELPEADLIYADPARRDGMGKKLFLLEDCSPNILELLPYMLTKAAFVMLKLSPMADIAMLAARLGERLRELHIVAKGQEVKELLCILSDVREEAGYRVIAHNIDWPSEEFAFELREEREASAELAEDLQAGDIILDPSAALHKTGAYKLIAQRFGLQKLDFSTQLFRATSLVDTHFFRQYKLLEILPFAKQSFNRVAQNCPRADVSSHNLPLSSEELQKRLRIKSGGNRHIFACRTAMLGKLFLLCESCPRA